MATAKPPRKRSTATASDSKLRTYQRKRDFAKTPEPSGGAVPSGAAATKQRHFVVQRHRARRLHYDFRLEVDSVLASWAVPKGPTLDAKARQLAVHVEDHPLDYADFEGVIPRGEYGGGDVIVWDQGTWEPVGTDNPAAAIANGELHFDVDGEKLKGRFVLIRRDRGDGAKEQWLLLHKRDDAARDGWNPEDYPRSVISGRTNDEVASAPDAVWHSNRAKDGKRRRGGRRRSWKPPTRAELAALDDLGTKGSWELQGRSLALTNLDKVLFPGRDGEQPVTKRELVRYYATMAPLLLPHLIERPLNLHRFPDGIDRPGFWHKEAPSHAPDWLGKWCYEHAAPGEAQWYVTVDEPAGLAWLANYGTVEINPWTSTVKAPREPTYALIDIDPGTRTSFADVVLLARLFRDGLRHLDVVAAPKVTGQRGIQIYVPVRSGYTFDETRDWVKALSRAVATTVPNLVSWRWRKDERRGKARLDYTQNAINKTLVAPYSARPRPGATVSMPIRWDELDDPDLRPDGWTIRTAGERVAATGDLFDAIVGVEQELPRL